MSHPGKIPAERRRCRRPVGPRRRGCADGAGLYFDHGQPVVRIAAATDRPGDIVAISLLVGARAVGLNMGDHGCAVGVDPSAGRGMLPPARPAARRLREGSQ